MEFQLNQFIMPKNYTKRVDDWRGKEDMNEDIKPKTVYQITNISDLQRKIINTNMDVINLRNQIKKKHLNENECIEMLNKIISKLFECENFEFVLEKVLIK